MVKITHTLRKRERERERAGEKEGKKERESERESDRETAREKGRKRDRKAEVQRERHTHYENIYIKCNILIDRKEKKFVPSKELKYLKYQFNTTMCPRSSYPLYIVS